MQIVPNGVTKLVLQVSAQRIKKQEEKHTKIKMTEDKFPVRKNIRYKKSKDREHLLDIYYPMTKQKGSPLIINIHGGRLITGDKEWNRSFCCDLARRGFIAISVNYRMIPHVTFPEQLGDIMAAYDWIKRHHEKIGYDENAVYVTGDSAGALLAVYSSAVNADAGFGKVFGLTGTDLKIRALGLISGMFYLYNEKFRGHAAPLLFGENYKEEAYLTYITPKRLLEEVQIPPCYLVTSEEDIRRESTLAFNTELEKACCRHQMHCWARGEKEKLGYKFCVRDPERKESRQTIDEMTEYFRRV